MNPVTLDRKALELSRSQAKTLVLVFQRHSVEALCKMLAPDYPTEQRTKLEAAMVSLRCELLERANRTASIDEAAGMQTELAMEDF